MLHCDRPSGQFANTQDSSEPEACLCTISLVPLNDELAGLGRPGPSVIKPSDVKTMFILPELSEQRRIAGRLEQADRLVRTRRYALELTDTFLPAAFLELFGGQDLVFNRWPVARSESILKPLKAG